MADIYEIIYKVKSYPIIFTLNPNTVDPAAASAYPRLMAGEVEYSPEFKNMNRTDAGDIKLHPAIDETGTASSHKESFSFPDVANKARTADSDTGRVNRQRNFEEQVLRSPSDSSRYRRIFGNIGIHIVLPGENALALSPFMVVSNGVSEHPLVIRRLVGRSLNTTLFQVSALVYKYLFA